MYGATPTATVCSTLPVARSRSCTLLPRVDVDQHLVAGAAANQPGGVRLAADGRRRQVDVLVDPVVLAVVLPLGDAHRALATSLA